MNESNEPAELEQEIKARIEEIDSIISAQLNEIMHHPEFQKLEASWRGLHYLVHESEAIYITKIKLLSVTKAELLKDLERALEYDQSSIFKKVFNDGFQPIGPMIMGPAPYSMLIGDYEFDDSSRDTSLLEKLSYVAQAAHAPFISAVSPLLFQWESFSDIKLVKDLKRRFERTAFARWRSLRSVESCRYIGLCLPHILLREPYNYRKKTDKAFEFKESTKNEDLLWGNAAFAFGACVARAYKEKSWLGSMKEGSMEAVVENLCSVNLEDKDDSHRFSTDAVLSPKERITLSELGFLPLYENFLLEKKAFFDAFSIYQYSADEDDPAPEYARQWSNLANIIGATRFVHYLILKTVNRTEFFTEARQCQRELINWLHKYVGFPPSPEYPLREAVINVYDQFPYGRGRFRAVLFIQPAYLLEDMKIGMRITIDLP